MARALTGADEDRRGRGETEGAGAGDDQDRHGAQDAVGPGAAKESPAEERRDGDQDNERHEDGGDLVGQALDPGLAGLGLLDEADNAGQGGRFADARGADAEHAVEVDRRADDLIADAFFHRGGLAGQERFIGCRFALKDGAVGRDFFARPHDQRLAHAHLGDGHLDFAPIADDARPAGAQVEQTLQGVTGLTARPRLEPLAQRDDRENERRFMKMRMTHRQRPAGGGGQQNRHRVEIGRARAHRDEDIHVGAAAAERTPAAAQIREAHARDDPGGEGEGDPAGVGQGRAPGGGAHFERDDRQGEPDAFERALEPPARLAVAAAARLQALGARLVGRRGPLIGGLMADDRVAGGGNRLTQRFEHLGGRVGGMQPRVRRLGGEIHGRAGDARQGIERAFDVRRAGIAVHARDDERNFLTRLDRRWPTGRRAGKAGLRCVVGRELLGRQRNGGVARLLDGGNQRFKRDAAVARDDASQAGW
ncbi:MAG: hypothetical protein BWZ08_02155 [candidate division BRC1 bacterium ADurb.BinA292]|nr:MAG: hypothetical protein BWZ08_02155 [candidate division BRC1 bacterium ADurb.BinA292]